MNTDKKPTSVLNYLKSIEAEVNKHGVYVYTSTNGGHSINLEIILEEYGQQEDAIGYERGLKEANEWIPVEEKLPENTDYVLVLLDSYLILGDRQLGVFYAKGEGQSEDAWNVYDFHDTKSNNREDFKVTHWMPLPAPPQQGKEETDV